MDQNRWERYVLQTATRWDDIKDLIQDTGIEQIDQDHRRLVEYIFAMEKLSKTVEGSNYDSELLEKLQQEFEGFMSLILSHYSTEEYYIDRYELPGKSSQQACHEIILNKFKHIFTEFGEGILSTFQEMKIDLLEEIIGHINDTDVPSFKLASFVSVLQKATEWEDVSELLKTTGVPFVDDEHKHLTMKIIELKTFLSTTDYKIETDALKETTLTMLDDLYGFTKIHFDHEVSFLNKFKLPPEVQEEQHGIFLGALSSRQDEIANDKLNKLDKFVDYLINWWISHVNGIDFVEFHFSRIAGPVFDQSESADDFDFLIRKTGIEHIDEEHSGLIGLLLGIAATDISKVTGGEIKKELAKVYECAEIHFKHEEKIMESREYKGIEVHRNVHAKLLQNVTDAMTHIVSGHSQITPLFLKRLMGWWVQHTNGMDYETFVLNKTLT